MNADGNLAAAAQGSQRGALGGHGKARICVVEKRYGLDGRGIVLARLNAQRTLAGRRAKIFGIEPLANPIGLAQPIESCGSQQNRLHLTLGQLAQPRVNIAAKLHRLNVGPEHLQLRAAPLAACAHARAMRKSSKTGMFHGYKDVARVDAHGRCRQRKRTRAARWADL